MGRAWLIVLLALLAACGPDDATPSIEVWDAWARPTTPGQSAAVVYLTIENNGAVDRLVAVESEIAADAAVHVSETVDGIARMRRMTALAIPQDMPVVFAPGGFHIMLFDPARPLTLGETFELTLVFETAGRHEVDVTVRAGEDWQLRQTERAGAPSSRREDDAEPDNAR